MYPGLLRRAGGPISVMPFTKSQAAPPSRPYVLVLFLADVLRVLPFFADAFGWRRSGSTFLPVERFHSSYWSSVISPSTSSCANFRRCALLLKGIKQRLANAEYAPSTYDCLGGNRMAAAAHRRRLRLVSEPSTVSIIDPVASDPRSDSAAQRKARVRQEVNAMPEHK